VLKLALATIHLMSLALGLGALFQRARALSAAEREEDLPRVFLWDNLYALVAMVWLGSGLFRAFGGFEKGSDYYLSNHSFWGKMLLLAILLGHEGVAMVTFIRWRIRLKKKEPISLANKSRLIRIHWAEFWCVVGMIFFATLMARGVGTIVKKPAAGASPAEALALEMKSGEAVYRRYCIQCHQLDGRGLDGKLAADFVADRSRLAKPDAVLEKSVAHGVPKTAMAGFAGELDEDQIRSVVRYVRATFGDKP
jgi:putative membrane protein